MLIIYRIEDNVAHFPKVHKATQETSEAWKRGQPDFYSCISVLIYMENRITFYLALCYVFGVLKYLLMKSQAFTTKSSNKNSNRPPNIGL